MIEQFFVANQALNEEALGQAYAHQQQLTKPEGALGRLEEVAMRLASMQGESHPQIKSPWVSVFAADHGIAAHGVSAFPQAVTEQMVLNFCQGGAAVNVLANFAKASFEVVDVGVLADFAEHPHLIQAKVAAGTADFSVQAAMTQAQLLQALMVGYDSAERAKAAGADLFIAGEMGIGNTTSATAMIAVLSGQEVDDLVGVGTGISMKAKKQKAQMIKNAIALHQESLNSPLRILQHLGGFEIAAMCGAYIRCAQLGLPIVVDGLMATVAVWIADLVSRNDQLASCDSVEKMMNLGKYSIPETLFCTCGSCPRLVDWCFFAHQSAEPAHAMMLETLAAEPMLQFEMRLGEGSGAALVIPLLQQACALHNQMATFASAQVSQG